MTHTPNTLFEEGRPWAELAARRKLRRLPYGHVLEGELVSAALEGLWRASRAYDPLRGTKFRTFAQFAIHGAMADWLRNTDHASRKRRRSGTACKHFSLDRQFQMVCEMFPGAGGIRHRRSAAPTSNTQVDQLPDRRTCPPPVSDEAVALVDIASRGLSARTKLILRRHYEDGATLTEISQELDLDPSRVSQLHTRSLKHMRGVLERYELAPKS